MRQRIHWTLWLYVCAISFLACENTVDSSPNKLCEGVDVLVCNEATDATDATDAADAVDAAAKRICECAGSTLGRQEEHETTVERKLG